MKSSSTKPKRVPRDTWTPTMSFRVPPELREKVKARAAEKGEDVTAVVLRAFQRYVR